MRIAVVHEPHHHQLTGWAILEICKSVDTAAVPASARALDSDQAARAAYDLLADTHKREHIRSIESAKRSTELSTSVIRVLLQCG